MSLADNKELLNMENIIIRKGRSVGTNLIVYDHEKPIYMNIRVNRNVIYRGFFQKRKPVAIKRIPVPTVNRLQ